MNRGKTSRALLVAVAAVAVAAAAPAAADPSGTSAPSSSRPGGELAPLAPPAPLAPTGPPDHAPPEGGEDAVPSADVSEARQTFRLGSFLAKQGQWVDALAAFERSLRLHPHPITLYNMAYCERALGRYAHASVRFAEALKSAPDPGGGAATLPPELAREAAQYLDEVRARVARVRVTLSPPDLAVRVDGRVLERAPSQGELAVFVVGERDGAARTSGAATFELWVDPGAHVFVATGEGDARVVESRTFAAGERAELRLTVAPPPPRKVAPMVATAGAAERPAPARLPAYIAFGVGAVGLGSGAVFAGLSLAEKASLDAEPSCEQKQCPPSYADQQARMIRFADFATAGLVTGLVGIGVGTYLLVSSEPAPSRKALRVTPWVTSNAAGISGRF